MKKIIVGFGVMLISVAAAVAQNTAKTESGKTPESKADQLTANMAKEFTLNEDQTAQVKAINLDYFQKEVYVTENGGGYEKLKTLEDSRDKELKSVMSRQQYKNYAAQAKVKYNEEKTIEQAKRKDRKAGHHAKLESDKHTVVN